MGVKAKYCTMNEHMRSAINCKGLVLSLFLLVSGQSISGTTWPCPDSYYA